MKLKKGDVVEIYNTHFNYIMLAVVKEVPLHYPKIWVFRTGESRYAQYVQCEGLLEGNIEKIGEL